MAYIEERTKTDGTTCYRVLIRLRGYPAQSATFERKTDAKKWATQTEAAIREGRYFKTAEAKQHTLGELIDRYRKDYLPSLKSSKDRGLHINWWKDVLGEYLLSDIRPSLIVEYKEKLLQKNPEGFKRKPSTVNRYLSALSHVYTIAVKEYGWVDDNPLLKITKPKESRGRVRFLDDAERKRLLDACMAKNPVLHKIAVVALSTGARKNEIMSLRWRDVDLQKGIITLHETKNGERRAIPLQGYAQQLIKEHYLNRCLEGELVFPSKRNPQKPLEIQRIWDESVANAKIKDFRFHDLRHCAASYLAMNGASLAEIAEVLGHKTLQMVKRYAHLSEAHTSKVVASMNQRIFG